MSGLFAPTRMSTSSELLSGVAILVVSLALGMFANSRPVGDLYGIPGYSSVLLLVAGLFVVAVGLVHAVSRRGSTKGS